MAGSSNLPPAQPITNPGAALVSTGAVRQDKRAEVSDLLKPGNFFKIN